MRITTNMLFNANLAHLQRYNARLLETSDEAASGLRLQRPSDDPTGTRRVLTLRDTLASLEQFKGQRVVAHSLLQGTEAVLQDTETLLLGAKGLALRAFQDTLGPEQRSVMAQEVGGLFERALSLSNSTVDGRYVFAANGYDANGKVFAFTGLEVYNGEGTMTGVYSASTEGTIVHNVAYQGTYTVEADCTSTLITTEVQSGLVVHYDIFLGPKGDEFSWIQTAPRATLAGFERRVR